VQPEPPAVDFDAAARPLLDAVAESEVIRAEDLAIRINTRDPMQPWHQDARAFAVVKDAARLWFVAEPGERGAELRRLLECLNQCLHAEDRDWESPKGYAKRGEYPCEETEA